MMNFKSMMICLMAICFQTVSEAKEDESANPLGCQNTGYRFTLKTLELFPGENGPHQTMYFFYNLSNQSVILHQMRREESARSMYINHTMMPSHWSVLAANENVIRFICSIPNKRSDYGDVVDCANYVKVCKNTQVRFGLNNKGNFWIVDNNSKNGALRQVVYYGIIP